VADLGNRPHVWITSKRCRPHTGDRRSYWIAQRPAEEAPPMESEINTDEPGKVIAWHYVEGSERGEFRSVHSRRARGTRHHRCACFHYCPPGRDNWGRVRERRN